MITYIKRALPAVMLAATLVTVAGCVGPSAGADSSGGSAGGGGPTLLSGKSEPAAQRGECFIGPYTIANLGGLVTGTLQWQCQGSVLMTLSVRLIYVGNNAERETEVDEGMPLSVDNITGTSPARLTAPCTTGLWKLKIVGAVTGVGAAPLTVNTSDKVNPPFNSPEWQNPTPITC